MERVSLQFVFFIILSLFSTLRSAAGLRIEIDREECFLSNVKHVWDVVHGSFVVIQADNSWSSGNEGVDLVVKSPSGKQVYDSRDKTSDKFEFYADEAGMHQFCFINKSPFHEKLDFDIHINPFHDLSDHAKDDHFLPLLEEIHMLDNALYSVGHTMHWLEAQLDRQQIILDKMNRKATYKAIFESLALVGVSILQIFLLRRLFERKINVCRV